MVAGLLGLWLEMLVPFHPRSRVWVKTRQRSLLSWDGRMSE